MDDGIGPVARSERLSSSAMARTIDDEFRLLREEMGRLRGGAEISSLIANARALTKRVEKLELGASDRQPDAIGRQPEPERETGWMIQWKVSESGVVYTIVRGLDLGNGMDVALWFCDKATADAVIKAAFIPRARSVLCYKDTLEEVCK